MCSEEKPPASLSLPGVTVFFEYGRVVFAKLPAEAGFPPVSPGEGETAAIRALGLEISCKQAVCGDTINKSLTSFLFKSEDICGRITIRPRAAGDYIRLQGRAGTKSLKKLFIERRIPARERSLVPVVADEIGVLAIYGLGAGDRAVPSPGDRACQIEFTKKE
jgi:tRNA(Ile)-lysidine synthase